MKILSRCFNKAYLEHINAQERIQIFYGGSSSGKSFFLAQRCIYDVVSKGRNYLICRNVANTIKRSVFNEVVKSIYGFKLQEYFIINKSDMVITCTFNNKQILFCGLDDPEKIKSITPSQGVITDIWVEEATETEYTALKQLQKRLRGKTIHKKRLILSFNPILQTHWIYEEFFNNWDDKKRLYKADGLLILKTTYKDNEHLTADDIKALEDEADKYYYEVYTLGNWGILGGAIYKNWEMQDLTNIKNSFDYYKIGLDFGYADHPSALIVTHYDKKKKTIYIIDEIYQSELDNEELAGIVKSKIGNKLVICDSAEPKSIAELKRYRVYASGAKKGPDSVDYGIKFLQKHKIIIDIKCQNFKNEISQYKWKQNKNGDILPVPVKEKDHLLDALRYAYEDEMKQAEQIIFP